MIRSPLIVLLVIAGCQDDVQLYEPDTPVVSDCTVCTDDVGCDPAPDGTACEVGMCIDGECTVNPVGETLLGVVIGERDTCTITAVGALWCWGKNEGGKLGVGDLLPHVEPVAVDPGPWADVALGRRHACAVRSDSSLWCWGENLRGQLGTGSLDPAAFPTQITSPAAQWRKVAAGDDHTCALTADGRLLCWGRGEEGQLGQGDLADITVPTEVDLGSETPGELGLGKHFSCVIDTRGGLHCWGANNEGQLGLGDRVDRLEPTVIDLGAAVTRVAGGDAHTCATTVAGDTFCFGRNRDGELGIGDDVADRHETPMLLDYGVTFGAFAMGHHHTCALSDGELWCWGKGDHGQLGLGELVTRYEPRHLDVADDWKYIAAGNQHTCGVRSDGSVYCWGANADGELGLGADPADRLLPTRIDL